MPVASPGADTLRLITNNLHTREQQVCRPDADTMQALGGSIATAQYLGMGREIHTDDAHFGMYVRAFKDDNQARSSTHELYIDLLSAEGLPLRRRLGQICLALKTDGHVYGSAGGFDMDIERTAPLPRLERLLGRWTAGLTRRCLEGSQHFIAPGHPDFTEPTPDDLLPLREFLNDPYNKPRYTQYDPESPYTQNLRIAEAPRPKVRAAASRGVTVYGRIVDGVSQLPFEDVQEADYHLSTATHDIQSTVGDSPAPLLAETLGALHAATTALETATGLLYTGRDSLAHYVHSQTS